LDYLGVITSKPGQPELDHAAWVALIPTHPALALVPPRQGTNPFTREPMLFFAGADTAYVLLSGKPLGKMDWAPDDSRQISVWTADSTANEAIGGIAADVAARLGALYQLRQE
jgi:hypothetical protein